MSSLSVTRCEHSAYKHKSAVSMLEHHQWSKSADMTKAIHSLQLQCSTAATAASFTRSCTSVSFVQMPLPYVLVLCAVKPSEHTSFSTANALCKSGMMPALEAFAEEAKHDALLRGSVSSSLDVRLHGMLACASNPCITAMINSLIFGICIILSGCQTAWDVGLCEEPMHYHTD